MKKKSIQKRKPAPGVKPVQLAKGEQLLIGFDPNQDVTPIVQFLEDFRTLSDPRAQMKSKLISIKIPEPLLAAFRYKATQEKIPYQTKIKELMVAYLKKGSFDED